MGARDNHAVVERLWALFEERRWEDAGRLLHDDFVAEYPQTGERFRGRDNFLAMNQAHPAPNWHIVVRRVVADDDIAAAEVIVTTDVGIDFATGFYELRDEQIWRATEYWTERSAAPTPAWRAAWTDPM